MIHIFNEFFTIIYKIFTIYKNKIENLYQNQAVILYLYTLLVDMVLLKYISYYSL